jgi:hypothetical protein
LSDNLKSLKARRMANPNLLDDEVPKPAQSKVTPVTQAAPQQMSNPPANTQRVATGVKDLVGEVWPINSAMGRKLIDAAEDAGVKPDYVYDEQLGKPTDTISGPAKRTGPGLLDDAHQSPSFLAQGLQPVKQMQQAIIDLSKDISSENLVNNSSSDAFLNFLVNAYMNTAKTTGKQSPDVNAKHDNFKFMLQTITRIGGQGKEQVPDGKWGPKTNNALQQIYSLAYALMQVVKAMGKELGGYTEQDLVELYNNIPKQVENVDINEKVERSSILAKNINKLRALYDDFREKIFNHPTYSAHISQQKPLYIKKNQKSVGPALDDREKSLYEQHKSTELDVTLNGKQITIMPYNLSSLENFKKFLVSKGNMVGISPEQLKVVNSGDKTLLSHFLTQISNELNKE